MNSIASYRSETSWFRSDELFDSLYPEFIRKLSIRHWTPLRITRTVIDFLTPKGNDRVLDVGSGIGKFCLAAAFYRPAALFDGIEQRSNLVQLAESVRVRLHIPNAVFRHGDFTKLISPITIISIFTTLFTKIFSKSSASMTASNVQASSTITTRVASI